MERVKLIAEKAVALLAEVRDICNANGLIYYLAPPVVIRMMMFGNLEENFIMPSVLMPINDALRFAEIIEEKKPEGRSLDYMKNNPRYRSFTIDYVDDTTTYIQLNRGDDFSRFGIKVAINMIRDDVKSKADALLETGWENNAYNHPKRVSWKVAAGRNAIGGLGRFDKNMSSRIFDRFAKLYTSNSNSERVFVRTYLEERKYLPRRLFASTGSIEVYGETYNVPADIEEYVTTYYMENWEMVRLSTRNPRNLITSYNIPFEETLQQLKENGTPVEALFKGYVENRKDTVEATKILKSRKRSFLVAKRSGDRLHMYEELHPQILQIRELRDRKDYEGLREIFSEYDRLARYYLRKGLALCPDEELMMIECELLREEGRDDLADKMLRLVPEAHKKPLAEMPEPAASEHSQYQEGKTYEIK